MNSLNLYDNAELLQTSFASPATALGNVTGVLAQAAVLEKELASRPASSGSTSGSTSTPSSAANPLNVPTLSTIQSASDATANTTLSNYAVGGSGSILDYQA